MASIDHLRASQPMTSSRTQASSEQNVKKQSASSNESVTNNSDAVSLSNQGKAIGQYHQQLAAEPQFDSAKVDSIKDAIKSGSYTIDPEKLAVNMMKFEEELTGL
ncbi:flagellar biosynthesis anti-sigma factor FlgM [Aliivibrio kagoshimensis]|uniref:flagellar biosynthesis anti-sigma factor FlgM n=1 Tax=Aliivibrio kagoshimensis TaxID=2910230 RepID=UPI003D1091C3